MLCVWCIILITGLTKPGKVDKIFALYQLKLPSLDSQLEIKVALLLFASRSFLANNLCFMVKLIDKAIVINVKMYKNKRKGFIQAIKKI